MRRLSCLLFLPLLVAGIDVPSIGTMPDRSGAIRPVYGVPGSFLLGAPLDGAERPSLPDDVTLGEDCVMVREVRLDAPGVTEIFAIGAEFIGARSESETFAIRIARGREAVFYLPEN